MISPLPRRFPHAVGAVVLTILVTACASPTTRERPVGASTIVGEPPVLTDRGRTTPAPVSTTMSGADVDLRSVFEEMGEDATLWYQHVTTFANPYFEGRVNGSAGTARARDYLEFYFDQYGLQPAFPATDVEGAAWTSFRQPFTFRTRERVSVSVESGRVAIDGAALRERDDFTVLGVSGSGDISAPVTFVGYGIENGDGGYTSFAEDTDLTGRIALMLRYEPLDEDGVSRWTDQRFSRHSALARKLKAVADRGPLGIIMVNPPDARDGRRGLEPLNRSRRFGPGLDVPVVQIDLDVADRLLAAADPGGSDLLTWRMRADVENAVVADFRDDVQVSLVTDVSRESNRQEIAGDNMAAVLPGAGELANEWLVIGGHYDHNGYGQFGTTPESGPLFPGADDNASGVAGMLLLAKRFSEWYEDSEAPASRRSVLFMAFDAEERGLHGSRYYIDNATIPPYQMTGLLNMDMIGRLRDDRLTILGTGTGDGLEDIVRRYADQTNLDVNMMSAGSGRSDDANFVRAGVPAMHFFTGMHEEYTTPRDHAYTTNPKGAVAVVDLIYDIGVDLATRREKLVKPKGDAAQGPGEDRGYAPVRLGIRPGMDAAIETGIAIDSVAPGTSADEGGLESGDVMLRWDDIELDNMQTLVTMLRSHKPGDEVKITIRRGTEMMELLVPLKASEG